MHAAGSIVIMAIRVCGNMARIYESYLIIHLVMIVGRAEISSDLDQLSNPSQLLTIAMERYLEAEWRRLDQLKR